VKTLGRLCLDNGGMLRRRPLEGVIVTLWYLFVSFQCYRWASSDHVLEHFRRGVLSGLLSYTCDYVFMSLRTHSPLAGLGLHGLEREGMRTSLMTTWWVWCNNIHGVVVAPLACCLKCFSACGYSYIFSFALSLISFVRKFPHL
jgi:hypothetical protein